MRAQFPNHLEARQAIDQHGVCTSLTEGKRPPLHILGIGAVGLCDDKKVAASREDCAKFRQVFVQLHDLFAIEMAAAPRTFLIFEHDAGRAGSFEKRNDMTGYLRVIVAIIDIDQ